MSEAMPHPYEDALSSLRIDGNVLLHGVQHAPWSVRVPDAATLHNFLGLGAGVQVIPFHLVLSGSLFIEPAGGEVIELHAGDVVLVPGGVAHRMFEGAASQTLPFEEVLRALAAGPPARNDTTPGTELLCGAFALRSAPLNPLLAALPAVLVVPTGSAEASPLLGNVVQMLKLELARSDCSGFATSRLLEILCAEVFKVYGVRASRHHAGWFKGLLDPKVSKALAVFHRNPGAAWTVGRLALEIAMSPSRFSARFREVTGQSVMAYVTAWRMNCACRELQGSKKALGEIAAGVGYQDAAAFSRAFKALVGISPAHWRQAQRA